MTKAADLLNFMFCPKRWHMEKPKLIIRVIGGALNFNIPYRVKLAFKRGLIRAATSSDAWIITGGRNAGVMRLVGEAVTDDCVTEHNTKLVVLGIVMWGDTAMQNKLTFEVRVIGFLYSLFLSSFFITNRNILFAYVH